MPPRWPIVVAFVVLAGLAWTAAAQAEPVDVSVEAIAEGEPLEVAFPGQTLTVFANVSVPEDGEHRAFLNVSVDGEPVASAPPTQAEGGAIETSTWFAAPDEHGNHTLAWAVTVESQDEQGAWSTESEEEGTVSFTVEERSPPSAEEVTVTVDMGEQDEAFTPGEQVLAVANVTVPDRAQTAWRATFVIEAEGEQVADALHQQSGAGTIELPAQFQAPLDEGEHDHAWSVIVEYRGTNTEDAPWEEVSMEEGSFALTVESPVAPPTEPFPWVWVLVIGAVLVGGAGGAYWWTQRDRQIRGHARSEAMQDLDGESFEQPASRDPEVHPQLKILEARQEDLRRMIELAQERYEAGDLTEHQYETIRERKEQELEQVQAEMDEHR